MKVGSIVVMVRDLEKPATDYLLSIGVTRWPTVAAGEMMVSGVHRMKGVNSTAMADYISLEEYPEPEQATIRFLVILFREVMGPDEFSVSALMEETEPITII